jgi:hypothetical protein
MIANFGTAGKTGGGGASILGTSTAGTSTAGASIAEIAATAGAAGAASQMPMVVEAGATESARVTAAETRRGNQAIVGQLGILIREVQKLNLTLPTTVRDAVERVL